MKTILIVIMMAVSGIVRRPWGRVRSKRSNWISGIFYKNILIKPGPIRHYTGTSRSSPGGSGNGVTLFTARKGSNYLTGRCHKKREPATELPYLYSGTALAGVRVHRDYPFALRISPDAYFPNCPNMFKKLLALTWLNNLRPSFRVEYFPPCASLNSVTSPHGEPTGSAF